VALYLLDTDTLSLFRRQHPVVLRRVFTHIGDEIGITVITIEEQIAGWQKLVGHAKSLHDHARASRYLADDATIWAAFPIFPQTEASLARFEQLVRLKLNVGRMDLRIASIALELGATVVTRNHRDFARVPNLSDADWTS